MTGPSRVKVSMELQVSDLTMELQILVLCQIPDDTTKTDFISFTRLLTLGCKSTYSSQYVRSGDSGGLKMSSVQGALKLCAGGYLVNRSLIYPG